MTLKSTHMEMLRLYLIFITLLLAPLHAFPQGRRLDTAQETTVSKVAVSRFDVDKGAKPAIPVTEMQQAITKVLNERSYVEALVLDKVVGPQDDSSKVVDIAKQRQVDAILTGEFAEDALKMSLRSGMTGRSLVRWSFPLSDSIKGKQQALLKDVVDTIVRDFPYRGYIMFVKGENVQLNMGSRHAIRPGVRLSVFEFEGARPTFSSPKTQLGEVVITKVSSNLAIGKIKVQSGTIRRYAKVDIFVAQIVNIQEHEIRYSRKPWASAGFDFQFLDTQTPDEPLDMKRRRYKLTLSPFIRIGGGFNRMVAFLSLGSASNDSNEVKFMIGQVSAEVFQAELGEETSMITSAGLTYSNYSATAKPGAIAPLVSASSYSGLIEQAVHYKVTASTRFYGFGQLLYPYFSSDDLNKSSSAFTSFGFGVGGGLRIYLFPNVAVESQITTRMSNWSMSTGSVQEIQYGLTLQGVYFF
ncbi:MAG: hypothetical protein ABL958_04610 [Bdellovibrionia bacterium]